MKIVVSGGAGAMAEACIEEFLKQKDVSQIVLCDIAEDAAKKRVAELGDKRLVAKFLDLSDIRSATAMFRGADVVANATPLYFNHQATKAALEAGVNYTDLGDFYPGTEPQLALSDEFKKKGVTAIPGLGIAPGLTGVMAGYLASKLDRVESIELKCGAIDLNEEEHSRPLTWHYAIETIIDEYWNPVRILEDGKLKEVGSRTLEEMYTFVNSKRGNITLPIATTAHPEPESFAHYFKDKGIKNTSWKLCFPLKFNEKLLFLRSLGFFSKEPINVQDQIVSPRAVLLALLNRLPKETRKEPEVRCDLVAIVKGEEAGKKVEYTISQRPITDTGVYLAIGALMLARGQIKEKGVFPPEFVPHELYFDECAKRGLETEVTKKWLL